MHLSFRYAGLLATLLGDFDLPLSVEAREYEVTAHMIALLEGIVVTTCRTTVQQGVRMKLSDVV